MHTIYTVPQLRQSALDGTASTAVSTQPSGSTVTAHGSTTGTAYSTTGYTNAHLTYDSTATASRTSIVLTQLYLLFHAWVQWLSAVVAVVGHRYDDLLGYAVITLDRESMGTQAPKAVTLELINGSGGSISLSYNVDGLPDSNDAALQQSNAAEPIAVRVYNVSCTGLRNTDGGRARQSDPYVKAHMHDSVTGPGGTLPGLQRLPSIANKLNPVWAGRELELLLGQVASHMPLACRLDVEDGIGRWAAV